MSLASSNARCRPVGSPLNESGSQHHQRRDLLATYSAPTFVPIVVLPSPTLQLIPQIFVYDFPLWPESGFNQSFARAMTPDSANGISDSLLPPASGTTPIPPARAASSPQASVADH